MIASLGPAALLLLVAGILLVEKLGISYATPWVLIGIVGFALSVLMGAVVADREAKRATALAEVEGPDSVQVASSLRRLWTIARIDMLILVVVVWAMTWKPGA